MRLKLAAALSLALIVGPALAWDGTDQDTGSAVEIGKGNLVREGEDIEVYDYEAGEFRNMTVESVERSGSDIEIKAYDGEAGESRTFEMDGE